MSEDQCEETAVQRRHLPIPVVSLVPGFRQDEQVIGNIFWCLASCRMVPVTAGAYTVLLGHREPPPWPCIAAPLVAQGQDAIRRCALRSLARATREMGDAVRVATRTVKVPHISHRRWHGALLDLEGVFAEVEGVFSLLVGSIDIPGGPADPLLKRQRKSMQAAQRRR